MTDAPPHGAPGDLLVVDDSPVNVRLLAEVLKLAGHRVRAATSGTRALQLAAAQPPDLVLLDLDLPDLGGREVCARLHADAATAVVPVVFVSAHADEATRAGALAAGGVDYLVKPFDPADVLARVATHLAAARSRREAGV